MSGDHIVLRCSYCEVYNEQVYDLLATTSGHTKHRPRLSVCEGADGNTHIRNLQHESFDEMKSLMELLAFGEQQRSVRQTALNHHSSRGVQRSGNMYQEPTSYHQSAPLANRCVGHTLLQLQVEIRRQNQAATALKASIAFADLAGSEPHPGGHIAPNSHAAETRCISMSLSALVSVVSALATGNRHVPYRDSKLTWLMRHVLGGNCQTCGTVVNP